MYQPEKTTPKGWYPRDFLGLIQLALTIAAVVWGAGKLAAGQEAVLQSQKRQEDTLILLTQQVRIMSEQIVRLDEREAIDRRELDGLKESRR